MAAEKKWKLHGMNVEMWSTSFRVNGGPVLHMGHHITQAAVNRAVENIYDHVYDKARKDAVNKLAEDAAKDIRNKFMED